MAHPGRPKSKRGPRPEIGAVLREALPTDARWTGIVGNPHQEAPHLAALRELGVPEDEIARVHPPGGFTL